MDTALGYACINGGEFCVLIFSLDEEMSVSQVENTAS
jgi:hypothetical protein